MTYASIFGALTGRSEVQAATLSTLRTWLITYLAEVERQEGLAPRTLTQPGGTPPPGGVSYQADHPSFRGGLDFETWQGDQLPLLIATAQPFGQAERYGAGKYGQWFEIQIGVVVEDSTGVETAAQQLADRYGKAIMGLLAQQGGLGTAADGSLFAEKTVLVSAPRTEFVDLASRRFARAVITVHSFVEQIADESQGPRVPPADPYAQPGPWPTITEVEIALEPETPAGAISPATGVALTTPVGAGQVVVNE